MIVAAAWIQAVGSIAAIIAAILISRSDRRHETKQEKQKEDSYKDSVLETARLALKEIEKIDEIIRGDPMYLYHEGVSSYHLKRHDQALSTVTLESLPFKDAFISLHSFRGSIRGMVFITENLSDKDIYQNMVNPEICDASEETSSKAKKEYENLKRAIE